jgi:hypothetical protein
MGDLLAESLHNLPDHANGLRAAGEASASPDLSTAGETGRLIAEGTLGGIMAINGSSVPTVSASVGWAETLRMRLTACQGRVCRLSRQVPAGQRRCEDDIAER